MVSIYSYQKFINNTHTVELELPIDEAGEVLGTELATIDGVTYVAVPSDIQLPEQDERIASTVSAVDPSDELKDKLRKASPIARLIDIRVVEAIRAKYTENDELKYARQGWMLATSAEGAGDIDEDALQEYCAYVEQCREWGRQERAKIGLE